MKADNSLGNSGASNCWTRRMKDAFGDSQKGTVYRSDLLHRRKLNLSNLRIDLRFRHQAVWREAHGQDPSSCITTGLLCLRDRFLTHVHHLSCQSIWRWLAIYAQSALSISVMRNVAQFRIGSLITAWINCPVELTRTAVDFHLNQWSTRNQRFWLIQPHWINSPDFSNVTPLRTTWLQGKPGLQSKRATASLLIKCNQFMQKILSLLLFRCKKVETSCDLASENKDSYLLRMLYGGVCNGK